jgi:hypothetical protein
LLCSVLMWAGVMSYFDFPQIFSEFLIEYFKVNNLEIEYLYTAV